MPPHAKHHKLISIDPAARHRRDLPPRHLRRSSRPPNLPYRPSVPNPKLSLPMPPSPKTLPTPPNPLSHRYSQTLAPYRSVCYHLRPFHALCLTARIASPIVPSPPHRCPSTPSHHRHRPHLYLHVPVLAFSITPPVAVGLYYVSLSCLHCGSLL